jgi:TolB-like protein/AraC-like DNA-binding protein
MCAQTSFSQVIIRKLTEIIHANLEKENFGVSELAVAAGMSRSSVHRKLKSFVKKTASQFIREVRLQKAMELLQQDMATASEIAYKVGFNSPTYFNTCFHHYFGYPPGEVRKKNITENEVNKAQTLLNQDEAKPELTTFAPENVKWIRFSRRKFFGLLIMTILVYLLTLLWHISYQNESKLPFKNTTRSREKSIVVLPFKSLSNNAENLTFAEGLVEDILNNLFRIKELMVISRTSGEPYCGEIRSAPETARELNVNFILEGSVQQEEGKVRIFVQLIDAGNDRHIWSEKYVRDIADIFFNQSSIAKQVTDELQAVLTSCETEHIEKKSDK